MTFAALDTVAASIWDASWHAAVVVAIVLVIRRLTRHRLPPAWRCALWTLVAVRLVLFVAPQTPLSLFSLIDRPGPVSGIQPASPAVQTAPAPASPRVSVEYGPAPLVAEPIRHTVTRSHRNAAHAFPISRRIALLWLVGAAAMIARTVLARRGLDRRLRSGTAVEDPDIFALLAECRATMGVRRSVDLIETAAVAGPALTGIRRPRVLLPPGLCGRLDREQLRFVLLHEMAHLRRHDVLVEWLIACLTAVHWFNPAVWLAAYLYRADREMSRDAMVLRATGRQDRHRYGHTLLHLIETLDPTRPRPLAVAMLDGKRGLKQRIGMIANLRPTPARITVVALVTLFAVIATLVLTNPKRVASTGPTSTNPTTNSDDEILQAQLGRRLPRVEYIDQPLAGVIDSLRGVSGARIHVNWSAMEVAGVKKDHPISARMRDVSVAKVIDVILDDAGGGKVKLRYVTSGGVITISTAEDLPNPMETRVYDVHDLIVPIVDYQSDATSKPAQPAITQAHVVASLIKLVRETIDPLSWTRPNAPATIQEREGQFVVTQDAENQRAVAALLGQLRETRSLQIMTSTRFVVFDPAELPTDDPAFAAVFALDKSPAPGGKLKAADVCLTADQTAKLLDLVTREKDAVLAAPMVTTHNGQQAFVRTGTSRAYVADLKVTRDREGKVKAYEPVVEAAESGLVLDVQGTVSADRKYVTLHVRPRLSKLLKMQTVPFARTPADHPADMARPTVQVPEMLQSEINTTLSVPDGQTLVLGGTADAGLLAPDTPGYEPKPGRRLYVLVTPHIIQVPVRN